MKNKITLLNYLEVKNIVQKTLLDDIFFSDIKDGYVVFVKKWIGSEYKIRYIEDKLYGIKFYKTNKL